MNAELTARLRQEARRLLAEGEVALVVGYEEGPLLGEAIPTFISDAEETDRLIFNPFCVYNPATFLKRGTAGKVAVVAKPCDTRSLVSLIQEKQLAREQLVVITVPCAGVVDTRKFRAALGEDLTLVEGVSEEVQTVSVALRGGVVRRITLSDVLAEKCVRCDFQEPALADIRLEEGVALLRPVGEEAKEGRVGQMESAPREERLRFWQEAFSRCIRCYACREVCPACFCEKCFVEETRPQWVARSFGGSESELFHLVRFMHLAGRCTECGECERACPMDIPLTIITEKMNQEVQELFGYLPGLNAEEAPPLARFSLEDLDIFGKG